MDADRAHTRMDTNGGCVGEFCNLIRNHRHSDGTAMHQDVSRLSPTTEPGCACVGRGSRDKQPVEGMCVPVGTCV